MSCIRPSLAPLCRAFVVLGISILPSVLRSAPVDTLAARQQAADWLCRQSGASLTRALRAQQATALTLCAANEGAYLFTAADGRFVVTSADDRLPTILGYGTAADRGDSAAAHPLAAAPPAALRGLLAAYARRLLTLPMTAATPAAEESGDAVDPLLTAVRHQKAPYNAYCPYYIADDGTVSSERCVVGCVATALEEVISYYRRTVTLRDTLHGWTTAHYQIDDVLPSTTVDTRLVRDNYDVAGTYSEEEADAVARLSYYCGMAAHMNWGLDASGAGVWRLEESLRRAFGMGYVHYVDSYRYLPADWLAMMRREIRSGRPVLYAGYAMRLNGHAFVLDGLDEEGRFHVNWGVDGDYDGYFLLDILNAAEPAYDLTAAGAYEGFFCNQEALLLHPDTLAVTLPDTLARTGEELVVESVTFDLAPEAGKVSPLHLRLRNTAATALTTPLELFLNTPSDTALFEQGFYLALTGVTLGPGEVCDLPVMGLFGSAGDYVLHLSADDVHILSNTPVTVAAARGARLSLAAPVVDFPEEGVLRVCETIDNAADAGRAGGKVTYELFEGEPQYDHNGTAHADYCFLAPGGTETDTVLFRGLTPGADYTLYVRYPWTVCHEVRVTCPVVDALRPVTADVPAAPDALYDLSGRRLRHPQRGTLYLQRGKKAGIYLPEHSTVTQ